jgi:hypothetical protein
MADFYARLTEILLANGYPPLRPGKGSPEICYSRASGRQVTVPRTTNSRHTANEILKQAGQPKAF